MTLGRGLRQIAYTLALVYALKGCTTLLDADEPWAVLDVTPRISAEPATITLLVTIPRSPQNRLLCVGYDGPQFRSSCQEHVGLGAAQHVEQTFSGLPAGEYAAVVEVVRDEGEKGGRTRVITTRFEVR